MALSNTKDHFGAITKTFHWLTALLILTAIPLGLLATRGDISTDDGITRTTWLFSLHKTVGVAAFWVAFLRILWALTQTRPALLNANKRLESFAAEAVHWLLYISMMLVPLSGWAHHAASTGFAPILWPFGQTLPFIPQSEFLAHLFEGWHFVLTKVLAVSVFLHIAGAIKHHLINKDATLRRMLPGQAVLPDLAQKEHSKSPLFTALIVYGIAMGGGTYLGLPGKTAPIESLDKVESQWTVETGTLGITIKQLGTDVTGGFSDWTADIAFDPETETGSVTVVIASNSLTLGSVTKDALGPDYLDVTNAPTASFVANIARSDAGLVADGTLTLLGVQKPLVLPFALDLEQGLATVKGQTTLNRIDFGVGATEHPTDSNLGFDVIIDVDLTARAPE